MHAQRRHRIHLAVASLVAMVALSSCGGEATLDDDAGGSTESSAQAPGLAEDGAFPVTIDHAYGSTGITERPDRIVTIGWSAEDVVAALGVVPVGIQSDTYGGDEAGYHPWFVDQVEQLGG